MAKKPYLAPLDENLAAQILDIALPAPEEGCSDPPPPPPRTVGEKLLRALDAMRETIDEANAALAQNDVAKIVAESLARDLKKRGTPSIIVSETGAVMLQVSYTSDTSAPRAPRVKSPWKSALPSLEVLRERAAALGVDISDLGRQKRKILERLEAVSDEPGPDLQ